MNIVHLRSKILVTVTSGNPGPGPRSDGSWSEGGEDEETGWNL